MVSPNRILCPIDLSDFSLDALRHGLVRSLQWLLGAAGPVPRTTRRLNRFRSKALLGGVPVFVAT